MSTSVCRAATLALLCLLGTAMFASSATIVITQNSFPSYGPTSEPIGPYAGTLNGVANLFSCLDLFKTTNVGVPYTGSLNVATTLVEKEAVWLTDQEMALLGLGQTPFNDTAQFGDLNFAIWHIVDPTVDISTLPGAQADVAAAALFLATNPSWIPDHFIFTPDDTSSQSFAVVGSTVPEPGTLAMLGSGILGVAGVLRRKLKA